MAAHETKSFVGELHAMSSALEQACTIASTLQELHQAEIQVAVREMTMKVTMLKQQLSNSEPPNPLPQQIMEEVSQTEPAVLPLGNSLHGAVGEDYATLLKPEPLKGESGSRDSSKQAQPKAWEYLPGKDQHYVAESLADLPKADTEQKVSYAAILPKVHTEDMAPHGSLVSVLGDSTLPAITTQHTHGGEDPQSPQSPCAAPVNVRGIWLDAKHGLSDAPDLRCFVDIVHYDEDKRISHGATRMLASRMSLVDLGSTSANIALLPNLFLKGIRSCACDILSPVGTSRFCWNGMCLLFIAYDLFAVPMQVFEIQDYKFTQVCEWTLTIWWTFDVYMTFRTGYIDGSQVVMKPRKIAYRYACTWLSVDLVIVILEWISRLAVAIGSASLLRSSRSMRMLRFMKLFRASKMLSFWNTFQDHVTSNILNLCITMAILGGILLLIIHVTTCIWYAIGESRDDGWITYDLYEGRKGNLFWYMASFRWVVAQFNGRTDMDERRNMEERLFTCLVGITLAVVAQAVFISFITKTMLDLSALVSEKTCRERALNQYLEANPLSTILTSQVRQCLRDYTDVKQELQKEVNVLASLPKHLQADVVEEVRAPVLMQHPFFRALPFESPWVMRMICHKVVQMVSASKDEVVFDKSDTCERMLFTDKTTGTYGDRRPDGESEEFSHAIQRGITTNSNKSTPVGFFFSNSQRSASGGKLMLAHRKKTKTIQTGSWISEAALWTEWINRGCFVSNCHGCLLAISAFKLAQELKKHSRSYALAHLHATNFASELSKQDPREISDVLSFEVRVFSPLCLKVTVVSANDLRNADVWAAGKSDPYCVCKVIHATGKKAEISFKTKAVKNNLSPVWNHSAEVLLSWHQLLEFHVYDEDFGSSDEHLGVACISPEDFAPPAFEGELPLRALNGGPGQGSLRVKIQTTEVEKPVLLQHFFK